MADFWDEDAGKFAAVAKSFAEGALALDDAQRSSGRILFRPTLMLAAHGLELMLKACMFLNGKPPSTTGRSGHDIISMWNDEVCEPVRGSVNVNARIACLEHEAAGCFPDLPNPEDAAAMVNEYIVKLAELHGSRKGSLLRYPSNSNEMAPRTPLLVRTLWRTCDDLVKRPDDFKLNHNRGTR